ncbi:MAG: PAS domain S-box protein, partial [Deltaproteobacteria bacterium]|nr:PAS domain S-box protein [Deltaproteobacteria bacterium]
MMKTDDLKERIAPYVLILVFIILATSIATVGYFYYRTYENRYRDEVEHKLSAVADIKVGELAHWRKERLGNAAIFYRNPVFSDLVRRFFDNPKDRKAQRHLQVWLSHLQAAHGYDMVMLLDTLYVKRMIIPEAPERIISYVSPGASEILRSVRVAFDDFYWNEQNQRIYLKVLVPVLERGSDRMVGVLVLRIDPEKYLYPFISSWPTPSRTAETLIVRREGNDAVFLNELRFQKNTALKLRVSLEGKKEWPAVRAVLGEVGIVEGRDYRGEPVIASVRAVPDSPWFLVARMDQTEMYEPARERLWLIILIVFGLLLSAGAGVGLIWRQQRTRFYRERHEASAALRESEEKFSKAFHTSPYAITITRPEDGKFVEVNDAFLSIAGFTREEALASSTIGLTLWVNEDNRQRVVADLQAGLAVVGQEIQFRTKSGEVITGLFSAQTIQLRNGPFILSSISDITEHKQQERKLREKNAEMERFTYTISHDLRSPLVTVKTFMGYLEQDLAGDDAGRIEQDMLYMRAAADKMGRLLDELLEMSRIGHVVN